MSHDSILRGTGVVDGIAYAPAVWVQGAPDPPPAAPLLEPEYIESEVEQLHNSAAIVADRFAARAEKASGDIQGVLSATAALARDPGWIRSAERLVRERIPAVHAVDKAISCFIEQLKDLGGLMAERATDLSDIRTRVIAELRGLPEPGIPTLDHPVILLAHDLSPADTSQIDPNFVLGIAMQLGGVTSHTSIIARQLGIPCVVGVAGLDCVDSEKNVLIDGNKGVIYLEISEAKALVKIDEDEKRRARIEAWEGPASLQSGEHIQILANVEDAESALLASKTFAEGVGLFRTELSFLAENVEPSVEEQARIYAEVMTAFPDRKVVIRTLDAGSDKPIPFLSHGEEDNPSLGVRGIRMQFAAEGTLQRQLDSIELAKKQLNKAQSDTWVMAPMIATIDEAKKFAAEARKRDLTAGLMVEVPSVALLAEEFLAEVDFLSIGTNDLTQYTMAADRLSPFLAELNTPWQPAVLRLIQRTTEAGRAAGKPIGVCGEAAADPLLACVLVGYGVTSLSMAPSAISAVGFQLARVTLDQCREAAYECSRVSTAEEAKKRAAKVLNFPHDE